MAILFDNGNFRYCAQVRPAHWGSYSGFTLTLQSRWLCARNPHEQQVRFFACLEREGHEQRGAEMRRQLEQQEPAPARLHADFSTRAAS